MIKALEFDGGTLNEKATSVEGKLLVEDTDGEVAFGDFSNISVVGVCLYFLGTNDQISTVSHGTCSVQDVPMS